MVWAHLPSDHSLACGFQRADGFSQPARQDSCQGLVWRTRSGEWRALVSWEGSAARHASFTTLEDAQAWCEAQIAELITISRCAP